MDDRLRPAAAAARKAAHGLETRQEPSEDGSSPFVKDSEDTATESRESSPGTLVAAPHTIGVPLRRPVPPRSGSPSTRRVTRAEVNGEKPVMYNMKHHPMDVVLRPVAARRVMDEFSKASDDNPPFTTFKQGPVSAVPKAAQEDQVVTEETSSPPPASSTTDESDVSLSGSTVFSPLTPAATKKATTIKLEATLTGEEMKSGWRSLSEPDRIMYLLQKGASDRQSMLPHSWMDAALALRQRFELGDFSDQNRATRWTESLQGRYAVVAQYLQDYFDVDPEPTAREDWTLYYAEDFDVYDYEPGDKYFLSRKDGIVQATQSYAAKDGASGQKRHPANQKQSEETRSRPESVSDVAGNKADSTRDSAHASSSHRVSHRQRKPIEEMAHPDMDPNEQPFQTAQEYLESDEVQTTDGESVDEEGGNGGLLGSYNDAEAYIRQAMGPRDDYSSTQESPEGEDMVTMRDSISAVIDEMLDPNESALPFLPPIELDVQSEDERNERRRKLNRRRKKRSKDGSTFSVHEDQPGNTPKIKRQIAMNPKSPGTDVPKENLHERSAGEET